LTDESRHREVAEAGRDVARKKYCADAIVPRYEDYYREVAGGG
jgi:hypothetical protein